jgi:hypothetical protein
MEGAHCEPHIHGDKESKGVEGPQRHRPEKKSDLPRNWIVFSVFLRLSLGRNGCIRPLAREVQSLDEVKNA